MVSVKILSYLLGAILQTHCVKSVQIRSFSWSVFSCIRTEYGDLLRKSPYSVQIPNTGKYALEKPPYLDPFHTVTGTSEQKLAALSVTGTKSLLGFLRI